MTDDFKDELERIAREAKERQISDKAKREERAKQFRDNVEDAFKTAVAFNTRVVAPVLHEFSSNAPGVSNFECEFKNSDSQPEFTHSCDMHGQRFAVSLLYWIAGSARITSGFGYVLRGEEFKIESFQEDGLEDRVTNWLKSQLLEQYRNHMGRTRLDTD